MTEARQGSLPAQRHGRQGRSGRSSGGALPAARRRCAVYTRKSNEEGLEQEYNSLHAQREACEAYVRSQQHEGWRLLPDAYDDGGLSGGTMQRPALQALLDDIRAGRVDTIVVYKVDRLTRSLADFAKMVEVFDAHGVSFVAVTQQFNTTSSMGRLTLNILLSFAQFEREVTGERIRDKIAASKRRGLWMGGRTPLGYHVQDRKLVVDAADAATVVQLYRRYLALGCVRRLKAALDEEGVVSKPRLFANGTAAGGRPYSRGALYGLLSNPVYLGQVRHKAACYPGQHAAIVPAALHAAVGARLAASNNGGTGRRRAVVEPSPLAGKLFDAAGERLVPTHARKGERRYRYYVSASLLRPANAITQTTSDTDLGTAARTRTDKVSSSTSASTPTSANNDPSRAGPAPGWRLPAQEIEQAVWAATAGVLQQPSLLVPDLLAGGLPPERLQAVLDQLASLARSSGPSAGQHAQHDGFGHLVDRVEISPEGLTLTLRIDGPPSAGESSDASNAHDTQVAENASVMLSRFVKHRVHRRGVEMRLVIAGATGPARDDAALLKVVARAHCWFEALAEGRVASMHELAGRLGITSRYVQRVLPLALLAPTLVERIAAGHHAASLTVERLTGGGPVPHRWDEQVRSLEG